MRAVYSQVIRRSAEGKDSIVKVRNITISRSQLKNFMDRQLEKATELLARTRLRLEKNEVVPQAELFSVASDASLALELQKPSDLGRSISQEGAPVGAEGAFETTRIERIYEESPAEETFMPNDNSLVSQPDTTDDRQTTEFWGDSLHFIEPTEEFVPSPLWGYWPAGMLDMSAPFSGIRNRQLIGL